MKKKKAFVFIVPLMFILFLCFMNNAEASESFKCSIQGNGTCNEQLINFCKNEASSKISSGDCNGRDCNKSREKNIAEYDHYKYCLSYYEPELSNYCLSDSNNNIDARWKNIWEKNGDIDNLNSIYDDLNNCMLDTSNDKVCGKNDDMESLSSKTDENIIKFCHLESGTLNIQSGYKISSSSSCEVSRMDAYKDCLHYFNEKRLMACVDEKNNNWWNRWEAVYKYNKNNDLQTYKGLYRDLDSCYLNKGISVDNKENNEVIIFEDNVKLYDVVTCGSVELPDGLVKLTSTFITILQIAVPLILIVMGMIDFAKATAASNEEGIKKAQQAFVRRLIAGACVFLVILVVKIVVGLLPADSTGSAINCLNAILNGTTNSSSQSSIVGDINCLSMYEKNSNGNEWKYCVCLDANDNRTGSYEKYKHVSEMSNLYDRVASQRLTPNKVDCNQYKD